MHSAAIRPHRLARLPGELILACVLGMLTAHAGAAATGTQPLLPVRPAEEGTRWNDLTAPQRAALQPLEREWSALEARSKQKWIDVATRLPRGYTATLVRRYGVDSAITSILLEVRYTTTAAITTRKITLVAVVPRPNPPFDFAFER